jgi:hypothetical protein
VTKDPIYSLAWLFVAIALFGCVAQNTPTFFVGVIVAAILTVVGLTKAVIEGPLW